MIAERVDHDGAVLYASLYENTFMDSFRPSQTGYLPSATLSRGLCSLRITTIFTVNWLAFRCGSIAAPRGENAAEPNHQSS